MPAVYLPIKNITKIYHLKALSSKRQTSLIYNLIFQAHQRFSSNFINWHINFWRFGSICKMYFPLLLLFPSLVNATKLFRVPQGGNCGVQAFTLCYLVSCGLALNPFQWSLHRDFSLII